MEEYEGTKSILISGVTEKEITALMELVAMDGSDRSKMIRFLIRSESTRRGLPYFPPTLVTTPKAGKRSVAETIKS